MYSRFPVSTRIWLFLSGECRNRRSPGIACVKKTVLRSMRATLYLYGDPAFQSVDYGPRFGGIFDIGKLAYVGRR